MKEQAGDAIKELPEGAYIILPKAMLKEMSDNGEIVYNEKDGCYVFVKQE